MTKSTTDRQLLLGILALQLGFIDRNTLIAAFDVWVQDKAHSLGDILLERQALHADRLALLQGLVAEHLKMHGNDPEKSLAAVSSVGSVRKDLERIADPDVQASLQHLPPSPAAEVLRSPGVPEDDPYTTWATVIPSPSCGTSPGVPEDDPYTTASVGASTSTGLRFRILRPHARGGLGEVFVAHDEELHREVALKEIQERHADNSESRSRFLLEAEITGGLEHPGIVPVYGLGQYADGRPFYAMRFIKGDSLKDAIERYHHAACGLAQGDSAPAKPQAAGGLEFRKLLGRFIDVCEAIQYAHDRGVLHRDLKPGNIMLGKYGETLVVDWGLAKAQGKSGEPGASATGEPLLHPASASGSSETLPGTAIGTPAFMSPEQAAGRLDQLGPASDVYSLGATLYCLLTGRPPLEDKDIALVMKKVQAGDIPRPRQTKPDVDRALEAICLKAMALAAKDRYASPRDLAGDLEQWLADKPVSAWPEPWTVKCRRWVGEHRTLVTGTAAALAVGVVGLIAAAILLTDANTKEYRQRVRAETLAREKNSLAIEADERRQDAVKLAADNKRLAIQARFDLVYFTSREENAEAMLGSAQLLSEALKLNDQLLADSILLHLGAWSQGVHRLHTVCSHKGGFLAVAFSPDRKTVLTGSADKTARLWETATGKQIGQPLLHEGEVLAVAFSPDEKTVLTGSTDKNSRLWEANSGKQVGPALPHEGEVRAVAFSPDGKTVATASTDKTACLWDTATGAKRVTLRGHEQAVHSVAFSPDGKTVVTTGMLDRVRLWVAATGKPIDPQLHFDTEPPLPFDQIVFAVAFDRDGKILLTGSLDGTARLWEVASGKQLQNLKNQRQVVAVALSPDKKTVLTGSDDGAARLWDVDTGLQIGPALQHDGIFVRAVAFSPDGKTLLTTDEMTARLWDANTGKQLGQDLRKNWGHVFELAFSTDGKTVFSGGTEEVQVWQTAKGRQMLALQNEAGVFHMAFSPDGKTIVTGSDDTVRVWLTATGEEMRDRGLKNKSIVSAVAFSRDGRYLLTGSGYDFGIVGKPPKAGDTGGQALLWDAATGKQVGPALQHEARVLAVAFSPDATQCLTGSEDKTAGLWEVDTGKLLASLAHPEPVRAVAYSPDGKSFLTGTNGLGQIGPDGDLVTESVDKKARLWEVATRKQLALPHQAGIRAVAYSPDGKTVLTGSTDGKGRLWEAATGKQHGPDLQHQDWVVAVAYSVDGKTVLTGSHDKTARLWQTATGKQIGTSLKHQSRINAVAFSPDGKTALTGSEDKTACLWDAATGKQIGSALRHDASVLAVAFSPDGKMALTGSLDKTARLWRVPQVRGDPQQILFWTQVITGLELDEHGLVRVLDAATWQQRRQRLQELGGPPLE